MRRYLGLLRSDLDPDSTTDAGKWLALALGPYGEKIDFWCAVQDEGSEDAASVIAQFMGEFTIQTFTTSTPSRFHESQIKRLSSLIDDERGPDAVQKLWPYAQTLLKDRPDHSLVIVVNEPLCRLLTVNGLGLATKPDIVAPSDEMLFAFIDLSPDWSHSILRAK